MKWINRLKVLSVYSVLQVIQYQLIKSNVYKRFKTVKKLDFNVGLIFYLYVIKIVMSVDYIVNNVIHIII